MIKDLGGLASYNLDKACAYYILLEKAKQYNIDDNKSKKIKQDNQSVNFGLLPNKKRQPV